MTARYREAFATPHFTRLLVSAIVGRFPIGVVALALVLLVREEGGSYAEAGLLAGAFAAGGALGAPIQGRLMDRHGQRLLMGFAVVDAIGMLSVVVLVLVGAPLGLQAATAAVAGVGIPPISSVMRTLWPTIFRERPDLLPTAFAVDSVAVELVFVGGPLVTALMTALFSPAAAIGVACVLLLSGTFAFVTSEPSRAWRPPEHAEHHGRLGPLRSRGLRTVLMTTLPLGFAFGVVDVAIPGFSEEHGGLELAGVILAAWSLGSVFGGLLYGARARPRPLVERYVLLVGLIPLGFAPMLLAGSLVTMLPFAVVAGAAIAPAIAAANQLVGEVAPRGAVTEAYTWGTMALVSGVAAGNAAGGVLVGEEGWRTAVLAAVGVAALAFVLVSLRRGTLRPSPTGSEALSDPAPA